MKVIIYLIMKMIIKYVYHVIKLSIAYLALVKKIMSYAQHVNMDIY